MIVNSKILLLVLGLLSGTLYAQDERVIINPKVDGPISLKLNIAGNPVNAMRFSVLGGLPLTEVSTGLLLQNTTGSQPWLRFSEDPDNGTNYVAVQAPESLSADRTLTIADVTGTLDVNPMDSSGDLTIGGSGGIATKLDHPGVANRVVKTTGASATGFGQIVNADVDNAAAIAGSKVAAATSSATGTVSREVARTTCTLTLSFSTSNGTATIDIQTCNYVRVGGLVLLMYDLTITKGTASGSFRLAGVPVAPTGSLFAQQLANFTGTTFPADTVPVAVADSSSPNLRFYEKTLSTSAQSTITAAEMAATTSVSGLVVYMAN
jgi:hypothetical protein